MSSFVVLALLGLGQGAMYAVMGVGLVVTYRGSGVVNLAYATMAAFPAMAYHRLVTEGTLTFPWVILPAEVDLGDRVARPIAFVLAVLVGLLLGALAHILVFRPLRDATPLTRLVASIGLTVVIQAIGVWRFGPLLRRPRPILPDTSLHIYGKVVPLDRPLLCVVVIAIAAAVYALLVRTRFGLSTRAAAESEKGAVLLGYSPDRLALANTVLASLIGAVGGILLSPIAAAGPYSYSFFVVPALAAALAGRLKHLGATVAVGIALGSFQAMMVRAKDFSWVPDMLKNGFDEGVPFLLIVVVLSIIGRSLPTRGTLTEPRQTLAPAVQRIGLAVAVGAVLAGAAMLMISLGDQTLRLPLIFSMVAIVLMLSQVVLTGYLGQISLAQLTFQGVGAFLIAKLTFELGWNSIPASITTIAVTTVAGTLVSWPATRIRGVQLAIVTLAFAIAAQQLVFRNGWFTGASAVADVAPPTIFGIDVSIAGPGFPRRRFAFVALVLVVLAVAMVINIRRSSTGRRMLAVRANERAAAAAGVDVGRTKLLGAAVSSFLAGTSGVLLGYASMQISPAGFESRFALSLLALGFLGGIGRLGGAFVAAALVSGGIGWKLIGLTFGGNSAELEFFLAGFGLLIVTRWMPDGVAGLPNQLTTWWRVRQAERATLAAALASER